MSDRDVALVGHLMRRAGFGATRAQIEENAAAGYDATVDALLASDLGDGIEHDLLRRYHPDHSGGLGNAGIQAYWLHRMVNSQSQLNEKLALFWHSVLATGYAKLTQGRVLMDQIEMFRDLGMGRLNTLLVELSRDPSMIIWLDNQDNHNGAINENYGRELIELFTMGVGNYTEQDVKECARAFTGWTVANAEYMKMRADNDSLWPYGRLNLHFEFDDSDHDGGVVSFLGQSGLFNGEDVVEIICRQPATARFIARHMYSFFVADEPPVTQWPFHPPRDPEAIATLAQAYFEHNYDIGEMLRVLFKSDFFKSPDVRFEKVKSPSELIAGVLRLTGEYPKLSPRLQDEANMLGVMGQTLANPPSVEGWHQGTEWIDTGNLVERINFASSKFEDMDKPGIQEMVGRITADSGGTLTPERLVGGCLDQLGAIEVKKESREALVRHASREGDVTLNGDGSGRARVGEMLRLVASTPEFQRE